MNQVQLVGNITRDIELKDAGNTQIARFTVACSRRGKKEDGKPSADFINCTAFGKTAEVVSKYFGKGRRVGLTGRIQTGSYKNKDGNTIYTTDVIVESVEFVDSKQSAAEQSAPATENDQNQAATPAATPQKSADDFMAIPTDTDEMELPFT